MTRREYACTVTALRYGLALPVIVRLDGDLTPGASVTMQARAVLTGGWVPAKWGAWSNPRPVQIGQDLSVPVAHESKLAKVEATVTVSADGKTLAGAGEATALGVLRSPVEARGIITREEELAAPPEPSDLSVVKLVGDGPETKTSSLAIDQSGRIIHIRYRNKPRGKSWLYIDNRLVADIDAETAHLCVTKDGRVWLGCEHGEAAEIVGQEVRGLGFSTNFLGLVMEVDGEPLWFHQPKGATNVYVLNRHGRTVFSYAVEGIPYDGAVLPDGRYVIAIADGKDKGIVWSNGKHLPCDARGVTLRGGNAYAGVGGFVMRVDASGLSPSISQRLGDSIDSMYTDPDGNTWISASAPDALYCWSATSALVLVKSIQDQTDGGALFRGKVTGRGGRVLWARNTRPANGTELYEVAKAQTEQPGEGRIEWWSGLSDPGSWRVEGSLKVSDLGESTGRFTPTPSLTGQGSVWLCFFVFRDGRWVGGEIDGISPSGGVKTVGNAISKDKGGPLPGRYGPRDEATDRKYLRAFKGEKVAFCLASGQTRSRTLLVTAIWQDDTWDEREEPKPPPTTPKPLDLTPGKCKLLWKAPDHAGTGTVILFAAQLIPYAGTATLNGGNARKQEAEPYSDGRGAYRYKGKIFKGPGTFVIPLSNGKRLVYAIRECSTRQEGVAPVIQ